MKNNFKKIKKYIVIFLIVYLAIFLVGIVDKFLIFPWIIHFFGLIYLGFIASFVFAVWLGIYSGNNYKRRWFLPVVGVLAYFCLFFLALQIFSLFYVNIFEFILTSDYTVDIAIIISLAIIAAVHSFAIRVVSRLKIAVVIRVFLIAIVVVSIAAPVGIFLNKRYCPTYYKYPDFIIKKMHWDSPQEWYGPFDQMSGYFVAEPWGAYYTYTDEEGNDWYYTIYYDESGWVRDIRMTIR